MILLAGSCWVTRGIIMGFSLPHLLVVLVIAILVFGTKRLKNIGEDLGGAIKGFKKSLKEGEESATLTQPDKDAD